MSQTNQSNPAGGAGRARRRRWWVVPVVLILLLGSGALLMTSRSWLIVAVIDPEVERMLGGDVEIDHARWVGLGRLEMAGISVRVPNHATLPEMAGEVAYINHATIDVRLLPLIVGRLSVRALSFDDVTLRLVEDARHAGQFTFFGLDPHIELQTRHGARPPRIEMRNVTLESGEFEGDQYTIIGRRRVAGSMQQMAGDDSTFTVELAEIDHRGHVLEDGLRISGRWDAATLSHAARLDGLTLDERTLAMCPQIVRLWWQHMNLTGRVSAAKLDWTIGESLTVELTIEHVGLTLPEQVEAFLVRYHDGRILEQTARPRMELNSGVIRWIDDGFELENLEGRFISGDIGDEELVHLPYRISINIDELPQWDFDRRDQWLAQTMQAAPFRMSIETSMDVTQSAELAGSDATVESGYGRSRAVDLPLPVARVLEQLQFARWSIVTTVEVWRDQPSEDAGDAFVAAPVQWRGRLNINDGSLRVNQFPYRLYGVDAALRIEQNVIHIEELHARGTESSRFTIGGTITLPTRAIPGRDDMGFDIDVEAVHLPLDDAFFAAVPDRNRGFFNSLFARSLYESFDRAGLVGDAAYPDDLDEQLSELETILREYEARVEDRAEVAVGDEPASMPQMPDAALFRKRDQLIAQIQRGPIKLGGYVHLNLRARREVGEEQPTLLTGTIEPDAVGVVFDRFPYPFTVVGGKLEWLPDRISIISDGRSDGLAIILPGGGRGTITGGLDRPTVDGQRRMQPDLRFEIVEEPMNELLAAAIPLTEHDIEHLPDADEWPGTAFAAPARLLQGIGLQGTISATGTIQTVHVSGAPSYRPSTSSNDEGESLPQQRVAYSFDVQLAHGSAQPTEQLAEQIGTAGLFWPDTFMVRDVQGHLAVSDERIDLLGFHGWHGTGEVFATGRIDRVADPTTIALDVTLSDLDLHKSIINLVPREGIEMARELWNRYQPQGRFTADLSFRETGDVRHPIDLIAQPTVCHITINGEPVSFVGLDGRIAITAGDEPIVGFENLKLNVRHGEEDHGELLITGAYGVREGENPLHVKGEWMNAAIESPVVRETMRLIGAQRHEQWFETHSLRGRVDAVFDYESSRGIRNTAIDGQVENNRDPWREPAGQSERYRLSIAPRTLAFELGATPIAAHFDPSAMVLLTPGHVQFSAFSGQVGESMFQLNGDVIFGETVNAVLDVDFHGRIVSDEIMALFPPPARSVLRQLEFDDGRMTRVHQSRLHITGALDDNADASVDGVNPEGSPSHPAAGAAAYPAAQRNWTVSYDGRLLMDGASMQIGVPATEIEGAMDMSLHVAPDAPPQLMMSAAFDSVRVIDRRITDLRAEEIRLSDDGTTIHIPEIRGLSYGGMVLAEATVGMGEHDRYELTVELAGLALGALYADHIERLAEANGGNAPGRPRSPRGEVFGGVKIAGQHGRPESRSGRGTIRAIGGNIENIPILLQAFSVLQLNVPLRGSLDQANAEFYIDGDRVIFERILFESTVADQFAAFQLIGHGWMDIRTLEINTQFRSRGGMLLLRDIAGGLGDQLYLIEVRGTPADPKAHLVPLPWLLQPFGSPSDLGRAPVEP